MSKSNLVSIIMPAFNVDRFIDDAIKSVVAQDYQTWELLICDDGSSDLTKNICQYWVATDSRISLVENKYGKGAPGARNSCLDAATGRFIAFLDSDDLWHADKLSLQLAFMRNNNYGLTFTYHEVINEKSELINRYRAPRSLCRNKMLFSNFIPCLTVIYDTKMIKKTLQPDIEKRNDYALWLKIINSNFVTHAYCFERITASYRSNGYGLSSGNKYELLKFYRRCIRDFGLVSNIKSYLLVVPYISITLLKKLCPSVYNKLVVKL